jgi:periplasmic protein TonB
MGKRVSSPVSESPTANAGSSTFARAAMVGNGRRRALGLGLAIAIELLIIALLFLVGSRFAGGGRDTAPETRLEAVTFALPDAAEEPPPEAQPEPEAPTESQPETPPTPQTPAERPVTEAERPPPPIISNPMPAPQPSAAPAPPAPPVAEARPPAPPRVYGPVDSGSQIEPDSQRVGTAPNGEPLYAAKWYREPTRQELAGYLSTATAPSAALIACRTVPDFRVADCQLVGESPEGSNIGRAVLAAAWQFRVRPARVGGRSQVGSWVRIRIDYTVSVAR